MLDFLEETITRNWSAYFPQRQPPEGLQPLILCATPCRSVILYFEPGRPAPLLTAKVGFPGQTIRWEYEMLHALRGTTGPHISALMPRPLDLVEFGGRVAIFEACLDGISFFVKYNRSGRGAATILAYADRALAWLGDFARETGTAGLNSLSCLSEIAGSRVWETGCAPGIARLVQETCERLAGSESHVGCSAVHGDFWMGNLLFKDGSLAGVVDWEYAQPSGESTADLFHFLLTFANYLDRMASDRTQLLAYPTWGQLPAGWTDAVPHAHASTLVKALRFVFFDDSRFARYAKEWTVRHLERTATVSACAADLFSLYLARQAALFYAIAAENVTPYRRQYYEEYLDLLALWQISSHESWLATLA